MPRSIPVRTLLACALHTCLWGMVVVVLLVKVLAAHLAEPLPVAVDAAVFEVPHGASLRQVSLSLQARGWVDQPRFLELYARRLGIESLIKAGEYQVVPGMSLKSLLKKMVDGDVIRYQVTLVEGHTFADYRALLETVDHIKHVLPGMSDDEVKTALGVSGSSVEGWIFPDTYFYHRDETDLSVLKRAYASMTEHLAMEWASRDEHLPYKSAYDALIMASIVEKETGLAEERPPIAGVFVRRLVRGIKLQTDPTVIYGMGRRYDGTLKHKDLVQETPWNTYVIPGLPPTPIASPGLASIRAALHPASSDALYFVARGDGSHEFSATLEAHLKAVDKFQKKRRSDYRSTPTKASGG